MITLPEDYHTCEFHGMTAIFFHDLHIGWIVTCPGDNWTYLFCNYKPDIQFPFNKEKQPIVDAFIEHHKQLLYWQHNKSLAKLMPS